jgi:outer membrane protein assembly factor BamB
MNRREFLTGLSAGLIGTLAGCSALARTSGFQLGDDCDEAPDATLWGQRSASRTGRSAVDRSVPVRSTSSIRALGDGSDGLKTASAAPVLTDGYAVTPTLYGLVAHDRTTGEREWAFSLPEGEAIAMTPVVTCGVVIAATQYEDTYIVDLESGEKAGTIPVSGGVKAESSPVLSGSTLLFPSGGMTAYDLQAGETLWSEDPPDAEKGACADESFVYVTYTSEYDPGIQAVDLESGDTEWTLNDPAAFDTPPAISDGFLYAVTDTPELVCVNAADGTVEWRQSLPEKGYARPAVAGNKVAVNAGLGEHARVFDAETGENRTSVETGTSYTQPVFTRDALLVVGYDAGLVVLERSSLDVSARHPSVGYVDSQLSVGTEEAFYVPATSGGLHYVTFDGE